MKFAVKAWSNGRSRAGVLQLGSCPHPIETPALLLTTRKGLPLFISPDLLPALPFPDSHLLQFSPLHFLDGISSKTISDVGGVHQMLGLREHILAAVPRDSSTSIPEYESTNRTGASFETPCGRRLIKPAEYMEMISSMKPDVSVSLADEVPSWVSNKRNRASVDRTLRWLDDCISLNVVIHPLPFLSGWMNKYDISNLLPTADGQQLEIQGVGYHNFVSRLALELLFFLLTSFVNSFGSAKCFYKS